MSATDAFLRKLKDAPSRASHAHPARTDERIRWTASRLLAAVALAALVSVLPTPLAGLMHGVFGGSGVIGPITAATSVVFWSVALLLTARGLRHGHRLAWALALVFLGLVVGVHLLHHNDVVETMLPALGVAGLVLARRAFPVAVSKNARSKALAVAFVTIALDVIARTNRDRPEHELSLQSVPGTQHGGAGSVVPLGFGGSLVPTAVMAVGLLMLVCILWTILSPRPAEPLPELERYLQRERAREIVRSHGSGTLDYFALRDDKRYFFHADSVVAYAVRFGVCLVSPDPIGPEDERDEVWTLFMGHARASGWSVCILGAGADWIGRYQSFGLRPVYLGDEAVVDCSEFDLKGRAMRGVRQACNRVDRAGYAVSHHDPTELDADTRAELVGLATVSRAGAVERGFSMTLSRLFNDEDTGLMLSISRDPQGHARAFVQWAPAAGINGWSLDVMRYDTAPEVPNGLMDHLIVQTIQHLAARGEAGLCLNFAILRTLVATESPNRLRQLAVRCLRAGSGRSQITSLYRYNQKFNPQWRPRYVVLSSVDTIACQGLVVAAAEGLSELPVIGRFMRGVGR